MKLDVCDICYHEDDEIELATYRVGMKHHGRISACNLHRQVLQERNIKTPEDFLKLKMSWLNKEASQ